MSYIQFEVGDTTVTVPDTGGGRFNVVVIFGGMHFATTSWMQSQTPDEIMDKVLVVFAPYTVSYLSVIRQLAPFLEQQKLRPTGMSNASVLGFSAGGYQALDAFSPTFKFVGLIDPSFRKAHLKRTYSRNVAMLWGSSDQTAVFGEKNFLALEEAIRKGGGFSERLKLSHEKFPRVFMERFKSRLF